MLNSISQYNAMVRVDWTWVHAQLAKVQAFSPTLIEHHGRIQKLELAKVNAVILRNTPDFVMLEDRVKKIELITQARKVETNESWMTLQLAKADAACRKTGELENITDKHNIEIQTLYKHICFLKSEIDKMSKLTTNKRKKLKKSEFAEPGERKYPVNDRAHAANAKARATQMVNKGKLSESGKAKIDAKANKILKRKAKKK